MRLDHLLSRETAEAEMRKLIPRSMRMRLEEKSDNRASRKVSEHPSKIAAKQQSMKMQVRMPERRSRKTHSVAEGSLLEGKRFESLYRLQGSVTNEDYVGV